MYLLLFLNFVILKILNMNQVRFRISKYLSMIMTAQMQLPIGEFENVMPKINSKLL